LFTGIIEEIGQVKGVLKLADSLQIMISASEILKNVSLGDSIAVNGVCLTITSYDSNSFTADVSPETYRVTNLKDIKIGSKVNLESALTLSKFLGGHIVSGHIDFVSRILKKELLSQFVRFSFEVAEGMRKYFISKGSVAIDGVSLTVNSVTDNEFDVMIIPHTLSNTILNFKSAGDYVNVESDIIGKYVENFLRYGDKTKIDKKDDLTEDFLKKHGFI